VGLRVTGGWSRGRLIEPPEGGCEGVFVVVVVDDVVQLESASVVNDVAEIELLLI
jgi:hypothetical protein